MVSTLLAIDMLDRRVELAAKRAPPPAVAREEAYFRATIDTVETPQDLLADFRIRSYVLTAFDMSEAVSQQALVEKVLEEGVTDKDAIANRMGDPRYRQLAESLSFKETGGFKFQLASFIDEVAGRYRRVQLELEAGEENNAARLASYFERKIGDVGSWYAVLADPPLRDVVFTALQIPEAMKGLDVDRLVTELEGRYDLEAFKNPEELDTFIRRFAVFSDLSGATGSSTGGSGALAILQSANGSRTSLLA